MKLSLRYSFETSNGDYHCGGLTPVPSFQDKNQSLAQSETESLLANERTSSSDQEDITSSQVCHPLITPVHYPHRTQRIFALFQMTLVLPIQKACPSSPKLRLSSNTNPNPKVPSLYIPPVLNALAMKSVALQSPPSTSHVLPTSSHLVRDLG